AGGQFVQARAQLGRLDVAAQLVAAGGIDRRRAGEAHPAAEVVVHGDRVAAVGPGQLDAVLGVGQGLAAVPGAPDRDGLVEGLRTQAGARVEQVLHGDARAVVLVDLPVHAPAAAAVDVGEDLDDVLLVGGREDDGALADVHRIQQRLAAAGLGVEGQVVARLDVDQVALDQVPAVAADVEHAAFDV